MTRRQVWQIIELLDGTFTVTRGNRQVRASATSLGQCRDLVIRSWQPGEKVWQVEQDGYRIDLTKQFEKACR